MKIILVDIQEPLCNEWKKSFNGYSDVSVHHGNFVDVIDRGVVSTQGLVSPANSFGLMDGGFDVNYEVVE
jgi:hypothetical protein